MKHQILLAACIATSITSAQVNETNTANQVIVSATRIDTPIEQMAGTVNVITSQDIENTKQPTVTDVLRSVPGISIARNGGPGQASSIYLRGAKPQHTLILIDGVRMNGQLDLSGYDLTNLQSTDIDRIEVLKGPQSTLYGSDAMAGVINIITKKGTGKPTPYVNVEGGSYGTWRAATGVNGGNDLINYSASISRFERQGQSARDNDTENDGTENTTVSTRIGFTPTDTTALDFTLRYINSFSDYDGFSNPAGYHNDNEQLVTRVQGSAFLFDDLLETRLGASYLNLKNIGITPTSKSPFDSETFSIDWQNTIYLHENHTLLVGIDGSQDNYEFPAKKGDLSNYGLFGTYQLVPLKHWISNVGIRNDEHSEFGNKTTYQASTAYRISATGSKLKGSWGTGFKAPTSYQLYSTSGNLDLKPETSIGWEIGFEQQVISNRLDIGATYFHTEYENFIDWFDPDGFVGPIKGQYENISKAQTDGVEVYASATLLNNLSMRTGYTYLDNDDQSDGFGFETRRPQHKIDMNLNYAATKKLNLNLNASYSSSRIDTIYPSIKVSLDSYTLVNLAIRYQITKNIQIYGRLDNLLDENYQTANGYNQDNIAGYAGVKVTL